MEKTSNKPNIFGKILSWFFQIVGMITVILITISFVYNLFDKKQSPMTDEKLQQVLYDECLKTVRQGTGNYKKTLTTGDPSSKEILSMKKFCLCMSDIKANKESIKKKLEIFSKNNNGAEPSDAEFDIIQAEIDSERTQLCNKQK